MTQQPATQPAPAPEAADDGRWRLRHVPLPLSVSAALIVVAAVTGGLLAGGAGAAGAAVGVALVVLGYLASTLVVAWADSVATPMVMPIGLAAYVTKITFIAGALSVAAAVGWAGLVPMAWGVAAGVVAWTGAHIWWLARRPRPLS